MRSILVFSKISRNVLIWTPSHTLVAVMVTTMLKDPPLNLREVSNHKVTFTMPSPNFYRVPSTHSDQIRLFLTGFVDKFCIQK